LLAAVVLPSATESDALSTALLTLGPEGLGHFRESRSSMRTLIAAQGAQSLELYQHGISTSIAEK
jgi:thiamine biosynthesis lipoprotein ApbE